MGKVKALQASTGTSAGTVTGIDGSATAKSADYTVTDTDNIRTILMTTSSTTRTVTLPTLADNLNRVITVVKVDSGSGFVTLDGEGAETINGATTRTIQTQYKNITIQAGASEWTVISENMPYGSNTNDATQTGFVGEYLAGNRAFASETSLTTATAKDILTSNLSLTAGDWDLSGFCNFTLTGNMTQLVVAVTNRTVNTTGDTLPANATIGNPNSDGEIMIRWNFSSFNPNDNMTFSIPQYRLSLSTTKTFQITVKATFSTGTATSSAYLSARRAR